MQTPVTVSFADADHTRVAVTTTVDLLERMTQVPGARWDERTRRWLVPLHPRAIAGLRTAVTTDPKPALAFEHDVQDALRAAAAADPGYDLHRGPGDAIYCTTPTTAAMVTDLERIGAKRTSSGWRLPATARHDLTRLADTHQLSIEPAIAAVVSEPTRPFIYDGTINGLLGVPLTELDALTDPKCDRLADVGLTSVYDVLHLIPRRYIDRSNTTPIADLPIGEDVAFIATIAHVGRYDRARRLLKLSVRDDTGTVDVTFFRSPWLDGRYHRGDSVVIFGKVDVWEPGPLKRVLQMTNPLVDPLTDSTLTMIPIYPQSQKAKVSTWDIHAAARECAERLGELTDPLPGDVRAHRNLITRADAYRLIHRPDNPTDLPAARTRLAYDELLRMQLALGVARRTVAAKQSTPITPTKELTSQLLGALPFPLTGAQTRALRDIRADIEQPHPMHRLLQGDVGSGKTVVALVALLAAVESGMQGALMAPTEVLASQLHTELVERTEHITRGDGSALRIGFLASKVRTKARRETLAALADGTIDIIVGTHALLVDDVEFAGLGLVVIDEQHRFGVQQRAVLRAKGRDTVPHVLVMTATPIPRTAAMTVFGDLDQTIIDELPPGRTPIVTTWDPHDPDLDSPLAQPWNHIHNQVSAGHQAYVVCSLVEESEKVAAAAAVATYEHLSTGALAGLRVGLVHGQMKPEERDPTMAAFKNGDLDVIISTTVIEVGVNVPNATVMAVIDAPRFGLAQLHQLRGRVGRGSAPSACFLLGRAASGDGVERMKALVATTSGAELSEIDMQLRGIGAVFGDAQSGVSDLRVADVMTDTDLLADAQADADALLADDPRLARRPGLRDEIAVALGDDAAEWLTRS